jgi:prolyl oligopeptidase
MKVALILMALSFVAASSEAQLQYPMTAKADSSSEYFGTRIADPYRWLEDADAPNTKEWIDAENKVTDSYLAKIPFRDAIKKRIEELWNYPKYTAPQKVGKYYLFYKNTGLQPQNILYIQDGLNGEPHVLLDPNTFSTDGTVALGSIAPSNDDKYLAYTVSQAGSDWQQIYVLDLATGKKLDDHIKWNKFSGATWWKDGFFYSRYDEPKGNEMTSANEFQKVYYHKLGTPQSEDVLTYEDKTNPKRSHYMGATEDERYLILYIAEGGQKGNMLYVKDMKHADRGWVPLVSEFGHEVGFIESEGDNLYLISNIDAPRNRIMVANSSDLAQKNWKEIIPQDKNVLETASLVNGKLICTYMQDASNHTYVYDMSGKRMYEINFPTFGSVGGFGGRKRDTEVFYTFTSFTYAPTIYRYDIAANKSTVFHSSEVKFDPAQYEAKQIFYTSKDGTKVPMFIVHKKGLKLDGKNPTYLYAYGGFNISLTPNFSTLRLILLENNAIFAVANLRGGGEYGEEWHEAGTKLQKQNTFDDFIAAAEYLFKEKYTSKEYLAIAGGSNGGLLVGAVMTQRPDICKVALPAVGVMDMLRYHKFTIGWGWARDYGTSDDSKEQFQYLLNYSPLHTLKEGINYPATLVTTADHDDRVVPAHSFKFAATLQEKHRGPNPVLIRIETKAGHGGGKPTSKIIEEYADTYSFLFYNMGVKPSY